MGAEYDFHCFETIDPETGNGLYRTAEEQQGQYYDGYMTDWGEWSRIYDQYGTLGSAPRGPFYSLLDFQGDGL